MAKATKTTAAPKVQPAPPLPVAAPLAPPAAPEAPAPGVIHPEVDPTTNQPKAAEATSDPNVPTGSPPPNATTVPGVDDDGNADNDPKGKPVTAQDAINRMVKDGEYATDEHRKKAMKKWPHLFAETAED